jgi:hypothetical protein
MNRRRSIDQLGGSNGMCSRANAQSIYLFPIAMTNSASLTLSGNFDKNAANSSR